MRRAEECLNRGDLNEAIHLAIERLRHFPEDPEALGLYGDALIGMGRMEELHELLDDVAAVIHRLNLVYERAGDTCKEKGLHREAAICYEKFISLRPETERARDIISKMALLEQKDLMPAEQDPAHQDQSSEPEFFTITMAQLYLEQGHNRDAEKVLERIVEKEPHNTEALNLLEKLRRTSLSPFSTRETSAPDRVLATLSLWLKNIERLKTHAAEKQKSH